MRVSDWVLLTAISLTVAFCGVFGCSYVIGKGYPSLALWAEIALTVAFTGLAMVLLLLANHAFNRVLAPKQRKASELIAAAKRKPSVIERLTPSWTFKSIAIFALIMAICWLPWFIANYPGGTYWDTYYQIWQTYPESHPIAIIPWDDIYKKTLTNAWIVDHHPIVTTLIYGAFGQISDMLTGEWNTGVAIFCGLQGILHVIAFTTAVAYFKRIGCPPIVCLIAYLYFALMPFISTWAMCMVKDSMFGVLYVPYFCMLMETVRTKGQMLNKPRNAIIFILLGLALCITKKQGIFVIVATAIVGAIAFRKVRGAVEAFVGHALLPAIVLLIVFPMMIFPAFNIAPGGKQETLGPLFQQTARYLVDYPEDVTPEEEKAITKVLDYSRLREKYAFDFQDSVKYQYSLSATNSDIIEYLKVYLAQGMRHPDAYFGALMSLAGYYVAPCAFINIRMVTCHTRIGAEDRLVLYNPEELEWFRKGLDDAYQLIAKVPGLDLPLLIVTYAFWLPAVLMFASFRRRLGTATIFAPQIVLLAFCVIAPVYDARYVIPIFDVAPLFFAAICVLIKATQNSSITMIQGLSAHNDQYGMHCPRRSTDDGSHELENPVSRSDNGLEIRPSGDGGLHCPAG